MIKYNKLGLMLLFIFIVLNFLSCIVGANQYPDLYYDEIGEFVPLGLLPANTEFKCMYIGPGDHYQGKIDDQTVFLSIYRHSINNVKHDYSTEYKQRKYKNGPWEEKTFNLTNNLCKYDERPIGTTGFNGYLNYCNLVATQDVILYASLGHPNFYNNRAYMAAKLLENFNFNLDVLEPIPDEFGGGGIHDYLPKPKKEYVIDVRDIMRQKVKLYFWTDIYQYLFTFMPYEKGKDMVDGFVPGKLYWVPEYDEQFWYGDGLFQKDYTYGFDVDLGSMAGNYFGVEILSLDWVDKIRFMYIPDSDEYQRLFFTVDFTLLDEEQRSGFMIDSTDEKYQLPDDWFPHDDDILDKIDSIDNVVTPEEVYDPLKQSIEQEVKNFIGKYFDDLKVKFADVFEIMAAIKSVFASSVGGGDWEGVKMNMSNTAYPVSGSQYIVAPGPINQIRVTLRTMLAGCMYLITGLFVVRKARDIF